MQNKELQITRDNVSALMNGKSISNPQKILNKTFLFDTLRINE